MLLVLTDVPPTAGMEEHQEDAADDGDVPEPLDTPADADINVGTSVNAGT